VLSLGVGARGANAITQAPHAANPERPTFATHAYAVAAGFAELEQGLSVRGIRSLREATSWDVNFKVGISAHAQAALFGPLYVREARGGGVGDMGVALKFRAEVSRRTAVALVSTATFPTGSAARGLGAGRALGGLVAVVSAELPWSLHVDVNAGPQGIGGGALPWFTSVSGAGTIGRVGLTLELFNYTTGASGARLQGILGAVVLRPADWVVADVGGVRGTVGGTPDQAFVGVTTNLGRLFR